MPSWVERHQIMTALLVIWFMALVTYVTHLVFTAPPELTAGTVSALATVYALPALAVGLWKWRGELISTRSTKRDG